MAEADQPTRYNLPNTTAPVLGEIAVLDVHAPHEKMHGIKDFLLHMMTITIGLFIALMLEAGVEKIHEHHLRDEADRNLRQEIRDNEHRAQITLDAAVVERSNLIEVLKFLNAKAQGKPYDISKVTLSYTSSSLSDASWRTATATGSLNFMDYDRVERFAGAYQQQESFARMDQEALDEFLNLQSYVAYGFDPDKVTPEEARSAVNDTRKTLSHVQALRDVGVGLKQAYSNALKEQ